jgi:hypothetical protein
MINPPLLIAKDGSAAVVLGQFLHRFSESDNARSTPQLSAQCRFSAPIIGEYGPNAHGTGARGWIA